MKRHDVDRIAATVADAGLDPVIDRDLACVLAICPVCESPDPEGVWRSLIIATYSGLLIACSNGCPDDKVHTALEDRLREAQHHVA